MKVTVELTNEEEIKTFYARMFEPEKPNITMYAAPTPSPKPDPLPEGFMPAPEETPFDEKKPEPEPAPEAAPAAVTYEMVQKVAIKLVQEQRQPELRALLQKHGLQALPELKDDPEKRAAFYADMGVI